MSKGEMAYAELMEWCARKRVELSWDFSSQSPEEQARRTAQEALLGELEERFFAALP
ncbi:hypothetical protein [Streptomyces sp. URMC 129]|uniref:hypothetical protein n=1 Tax=Streptomyces sp. URMC 129 TaxID=3423407 RepID=UPI003F1D448F